MPEDDTVVNSVDYKQDPEDTAHYGELVRDFLYYLGSHDDLAKEIADLMINSEIAKSAELGARTLPPVLQRTAKGVTSFGR